MGTFYRVFDATSLSGRSNLCLMIIFVQSSGIRPFMWLHPATKLRAMPPFIVAACFCRSRLPRRLCSHCLPSSRSSFLMACSAAMLNFPLASYIAAGEFTEAQLDAIDARLAAGKPAPGQHREELGGGKGSKRRGACLIVRVAAQHACHAWHASIHFHAKAGSRQLLLLLADYPQPLTALTPFSCSICPGEEQGQAQAGASSPAHRRSWGWRRSTQR